MRLWSGRLLPAAAAVVALAIGACMPPPAVAPAETVTVAVRADPVELDPEDPRDAAASAARVGLGRLRFEAGFELRSTDPRFGGLSGLLVTPGGERLIAISDRGTIWTAALDHDARGRLTGIGGWSVQELRRGPGDPPPSRAGDAESLARLDGSVIVAFEQAHRLRRLPLDDLGAVPEPVPAFEGVLGDGDGNAGIEALTDLPGGGLLAIAEGAFEPDGSLSAWIVDAGGGGTARLGYVPGDGFRPTGADRLGDDVFVLERRFSLLGGFQARIVRLKASDVRPGTRLRGEELGRLRPPLPADNFEGLAVRRAEGEGDDGRVLLHLVSDDNFLALQRTLLLQFSWRPEAP